VLLLNECSLLLFRYRVSQETFGYILVPQQLSLLFISLSSQSGNFWVYPRTSATLPSIN